MQAEVDKFIVSHRLLRRQAPALPARLRRALFERAGRSAVGERAGGHRQASGYAQRSAVTWSARWRGARRAGVAGAGCRGAERAAALHRSSNARAHIEQTA
jgi:hypothetical protein